MNDLKRRLAGRYELDEIIGRGGMGAVYRATDLVLRRTVAVKLLPSALAEEDPQHVRRFEREARATASLTHPGVVAVYDAGQDEDTRFIVMECIDGRSLARVLREQAPLEPATAATIAARVADALAAAHGAGIVHRDVKPANVMLTADGGVKVLDFGIAHAADGTSLTQSTSVLGTARYMSPEQALGRRADGRSDIYALGCLLYAMVTGRPPFEGDSAAAVMHQHVNSEPPPPSALNPRVPPTLDALGMQMLAKSPAARPQDASRVAERLRGAADPPPGAPDAATLVMPRRNLRAARRRGAAAAAVAAAALLIGVLAAGLAGGSDGERSRGAAPGSGVSSAGTRSAPTPAGKQPAAAVPTQAAPASPRRALQPTARPHKGEQQPGHHHGRHDKGAGKAAKGKKEGNGKGD